MDIIIYDWQKEYFRDNYTTNELVLFAYLCMLNKDVVEISYKNIEVETSLKDSNIKLCLRFLQIRNLIKKIGKGKYQILTNKNKDIYNKINNNTHEPENDRAKFDLSNDTIGQSLTYDTSDRAKFDLSNDKKPFSDEKIDNPLVYKHKYNNSLNINTSNNITSKEENISSNICLNKKENTPYFLEKENIYKEKDTSFPNKENEPPLYEVLFNEFWEAYPRAKNRTIRTNKDKCLNKYRHFTHLKQTHKAIMDTIAYLKTTQQWTKDDGDFIPMTYTFLNSKIWEQDDIVAIIQNKQQEESKEKEEREEYLKIQKAYLEKREKNQRYMTYAFLCSKGLTKETVDEERKALFEEFDPTKEERRKRILENNFYGLDSQVEFSIKQEFNYKPEIKNAPPPQEKVEGITRLFDGLEVEVINSYDKNNTTK